MRQLTQQHLPLSSRPMVKEPILPAADQGSLTEIIMAEGSAIQPMQLLPLLAQCSHQQRWLMWLCPHMPITKAYLKALGLENSPVVYLDINRQTQFDKCVRVLTAGTSHIITEWQGALSEHERMVLEEKAKNSGSHMILIRRR